MNKLILFKRKEDCSGCGACKNICPKSSITMKEDEYGFKYPELDETGCIHCGLCIKACGYKKYNLTVEPSLVYAAAAKSEEKIKKSTSGGAFQILAETVLSEGGIVYGASLYKVDTKLKVLHIGIENQQDLEKILGSKYVQSDIGESYQEIRNWLIKGRKVLFSGTPCQVSSLREYLHKEYSNLVTVDIICHGVPSVRFFQDYIRLLEKKYQKSVSNITFRDKTKGWGMAANVHFLDKESKNASVKRIPCNVSSFYHLFLSAKSYRKNCYYCKFASKYRCSDITLGDFWGIEKEYPQLVRGSKKLFELKNGISCILINSDIGNVLFQKSIPHLNIFESSFDIVQKYNEQLRKPVDYPVDREIYMQEYRKNGYEAVEKMFNKKLGMKKIYYYVNELIPKNIKTRIKMSLQRN